MGPWKRSTPVKQLLTSGFHATGFLAALLLVGCRGSSDPEPESSPDAALDASSVADGPDLTFGDGPFQVVAPPPARPCNGWPALCDRRYDEQVVPTSHATAANASPPFRFPAQAVSIPDQLTAWVRGIMLEVHDRGGDLVCCNGSCDDGYSSLHARLSEVAGFLAVNPREAVTLLIDNQVAASRIAEAFDRAKLTPLLFTYDESVGWPTLGSMIG
jgi:hypothetical protein